PSYTQPLMYRRIDEHQSIRKLYVESLVKRGDITLDEAGQAMTDFQTLLQQALDATRVSATTEPHAPRRRQVVGARPPLETGVSRAVLDELTRVLASAPDDFCRHPKLDRQLEARDKMYGQGEVDWALAESLAFGSILAEGQAIRLAGQDSRRGTFSHRHSTFVSYEDGSEHMPLQEVAVANNTNLWIYDSLLSEYAALGFEYGYSVASPEVLVIWEAQFGDFMNGAQIIIDQFIVAAEDKWDQQSGLVLLLPHGLEGQGPEHSSARIERFLGLAAEDNMTIVNASTSAQYFHALRRQAHEPIKRPLVLFTPKSLLRARAARSPVTDLVNGRFQMVLADSGVGDPAAVRRILFTSGKVSHEALAERDSLGSPVAVERVEQLYPWPFDDVAAAVARYPNATEIVWLQEEPENMGSWDGVKGRLYEAHENTHVIRRVSRLESGSPATGSAAVHAWEQADLLRRAFDGL
ncbi:MAG: multifunctional oxoglutarate decarboxylase/oxoglutarate dehydrogenase thiamine pyrophosphate-binding subunit/dihydrolipoyllysine-residue succinyltransferase subunit, partial [Acidimicrobiales bacterium]